jgi:hypothetical protein
MRADSPLIVSSFSSELAVSHGGGRLSRLGASREVTAFIFATHGDE